MTRDTADKVLGAAAELFGERGYTATSTRAIAERAGVNEVTLFRRFENKLGILKALGARWADQQTYHQVEREVDPEDTRATLLNLARMEVASAKENGGAAMRLAFESRSVPEVAELIGDGPRRNMQGLAAYMAMRQSAGDLRSDVAPEALAEAFFSLTSSYVMYRMVLGGGPMPTDAQSDERIEQLIEVFWSGAASRS